MLGIRCAQQVSVSADPPPTERLHTLKRCDTRGSLTSPDSRGAGVTVTVRFAHPSTPAQRSWLAQTLVRLRGIHFSPLDNQALDLLQMVQQMRYRFCLFSSSQGAQHDVSEACHSLLRRVRVSASKCVMLAAGIQPLAVPFAQGRGYVDVLAGVLVCTCAGGDAGPAQQLPCGSSRAPPALIRGDDCGRRR